MSTRNTSQRRAILTSLDQSRGFISAQELYGRLGEHGERVALATVYAQLKKLVASGDVDTVMTDRGESLYRRCAADAHHHHLACRLCGATVEIDIPSLERWTSAVGRERGYRDVHHVLELTGICPTCQNQSR